MSNTTIKVTGPIHHGIKLEIEDFSIELYTPEQPLAQKVLREIALNKDADSFTMFFSDSYLTKEESGKKANLIVLTANKNELLIDDGEEHYFPIKKDVFFAALISSFEAEKRMWAAPIQATEALAIHPDKKEEYLDHVVKPARLERIEKLIAAAK